MANFLLIVDGMTDEAFPRGWPPVFSGCPNFDALRKSGAYGKFQTCPEGCSVDSMACILTLLGFSKDRFSGFGRAALEALAIGVRLSDRDLVLRCSAVAVKDGRLTAPSRSEKIWDSPRLPDGAELYRLSGYKGILVLRGLLDTEEIRTFPPHEHWGEPAETLLPSGKAVAAVLRNFCRMTETPGAVLIPWGTSGPARLPDFRSEYGVSGAAVCGTEIVRGIAQALNLFQPRLFFATGDVDTNLQEKTDAALDLSRQYPFVLIHVNGADEAAHRRCAEEKIRFLRQVDQKVVGPLSQAGRVLICSDHTSSPVTGRHESGPQPFLLYGNEKFRGNLGIFPGTECVRLLMDEGLKWQDR